MRFVPLPNGIPSASVLGLGTAAMMGSASRRQSLAALHAAHSAGINFFDTARSYGYGAAEALLGEFLASSARRSEVVLCTKFGILPAPRSWRHRVAPAARAAIRLVPALRTAARRQAAGQFAPNQFTLETLRTSFETSLRELRTDYVDILLLHAAPPSVLAQDDLLEALARLVEQGKVRLAGISGELDTIEATLARRPPVLGSAQFAASLHHFAFLNRLSAAFPSSSSVSPAPLSLRGAAEEFASSPAPKLFLVANHPFGGPSGVAETRARIAALAQSPTLPADLRARLDPADPELLPDVILNAILTGTGIDAVIPAMLTPRHLESNVRAVTRSRFTPAELTLLRHSLAPGS